jgi:hypothetical protein
LAKVWTRIQDISFWSPRHFLFDFFFFHFSYSCLSEDEPSKKPKTIGKGVPFSVNSQIHSDSRYLKLEREGKKLELVEDILDKKIVVLTATRASGKSTLVRSLEDKNLIFI